VGAVIDIDVGERLYRQGWDQGCLLPAVGHAFYELGVDGTWQLQDSYAPEPGELLIVASQACDIVSRSELYVETMPCLWQPKGSPQYNGARLGNSGRYFLLRKEQNHQGQDGALIVDATRKIQISKVSLAELTPMPPVDQEVLSLFSRKFRAWLGGRYSRPALEPAVVSAVQKPIVDALAALRPDSELYDAPELVREVRMHPVEGDPPYEVDLIVLLNDGVSPDDERVAGFRGLLEVALDESPGGSRIGRCNAFRADQMYVSEYEETLKLPLDSYTFGGEDVQGAEPVHGIDHG
jgi:hypothetical protein